MTAHCRPEQYVTDADIEEAADIYIIAHESSPSIMVTLAKIAAKIHEQRSNSASPPLTPTPLRVEEENPSRYSHYREGDGIMRRDHDLV